MVLVLSADGEDKLIPLGVPEMGMTSGQAPVCAPGPRNYLHRVSVDAGRARSASGRPPAASRADLRSGHLEGLQHFISVHRCDLRRLVAWTTLDLGHHFLLGV